MIKKLVTYSIFPFVLIALYLLYVEADNGIINVVIFLILLNLVINVIHKIKTETKKVFG